MVRGWSHCSVHKLAEQHRSKEQLRHMQRFSRPCPPPPEQQPTAAPAAAFQPRHCSCAPSPLLQQWHHYCGSGGALPRRHGGAPPLQQGRCSGATGSTSESRWSRPAQSWLPLPPAGKAARLSSLRLDPPAAGPGAQAVAARDKRVARAGQ